jgi:ribosomal protein L37E
MLPHTSTCSVSDIIFICAYGEIKQQLEKDSMNHQTEKYHQNGRTCAMNNSRLFTENCSTCAYPEDKVVLEGNYCALLQNKGYST